MSLFIPRVFSNITKDRIHNTMEMNLLGKVKRVDLVNKIDDKGKAYNSAYIHFHYWYNSIIVENFQERIRNPEKQARIVYEDPWYWIIIENYNTNTNTNINSKKKYNKSHTIKNNTPIDENTYFENHTHDVDCQFDEDTYWENRENDSYEAYKDDYNDSVCNSSECSTDFEHKYVYEDEDEDEEQEQDWEKDRRCNNNENKNENTTLVSQDYVEFIEQELYDAREFEIQLLREIDCYKATLTKEYGIRFN